MKYTTQLKYLFVTCSTGIEKLLCNELNSLGFQVLSTAKRGVIIQGSDNLFSDVFRVNYLSRLATRVLLPLKEFNRIKGNDDLYQGIRGMDWKRFFPNQSVTFSIDSNIHHNAFNNSQYVSQLIKDGIVDNLRDKTGNRPNVDTKNPNFLLNLFLTENQSTIYFDTSTEPLFKRGYRSSTGEAPLHENLAAAMLHFSNWHESCKNVLSRNSSRSREVLYDPCCGSATLLIEAALMATNTPPSFFRKNWAFMHLPEFDLKQFQNFKKIENEKILKINNDKILIYGTEIDKEVFNSAISNIQLSHFHHPHNTKEFHIQVYNEDCTKFNLPNPPSLVITNPPYGNRVGESKDLPSLYRKLGDIFKGQTVKPSTATILSANEQLEDHIHLHTSKKLKTRNGGLEATIKMYEMFDGKKRERNKKVET
eukprot:TRINITY_DN3394_c0_g2_i1.p1 TRINITY_DN3394_c0_g2~~TRINITY_DN3394_c0_g2_i1.p1  ORF type:complete len:422 (-),score=93.76 TRINITY_DN3394_c0_g2_i1:113-1378(-)